MTETSERKMNARKKLRDTVVNSSVSDDWYEARDEWEVIDVDTCGGNGECYCGQDNLVYLYRIRNIKNKNELYPIGSSCVLHFENDKMTDEMKILDYGDREMKYGKLKGMTMKEICNNYKDYVEWLSENYKGGKKIRQVNEYNKLLDYYHQLKRLKSS